MFSKEEITKASSVDIIDYCQQNNIEVVSDNERWYRLGEHDSLVIDRLKNYFYWNSRQVGGNTIKFLQEVEGCSFKEAMCRLADEDNKYQNIAEVEYVVEPYEYNHENESSHFDKARNYLVNTRKIDAQIVDNLHKQGLIKQDKKNNVLFLWKEHEHIMGCSEQGTVHSDNFKRGSWKSIQKNSTANYGFNVLYGQPKHLKFFESSIDLLSYATLNKDKLNDMHLVSMEGLRESTIMKYFMRDCKLLGDAPDSVALCVDHDKAGLNFIKTLKFQKKDGSTHDFIVELPKPPSNEKKWDWNDECKEKVLKEWKKKVNHQNFHNGIKLNR